MAVRDETPALAGQDLSYEFGDRPRIAEACDVILTNCYPFWEGCQLEYSLLYLKEMSRKTGWL